MILAFCLPCGTCPPHTNHIEIEMASNEQRNKQNGVNGRGPLPAMIIAATAAQITGRAISHRGTGIAGPSGSAPCFIFGQFAPLPTLAAGDSTSSILLQLLQGNLRWL